MQSCRIAILLLAILPLGASAQLAPAAAPAATPQTGGAGGANTARKLCTETLSGQFNCSNLPNRTPAQREFRQAVELQLSTQEREALEHFEQAVKLDTGNLDYRAVLAAARQKLVSEDIQHGHRALADGNRIEALASFEDALELDPENEFARQQLQQFLPLVPLPEQRTPAESLPESLELKPNANTQTFHIAGDAQVAIVQVCAAYGILATLDDSVSRRPVKLDLDRATWAEASRAITQLTHTFWTPLSKNQALFAAESANHRQELERSFERTYYLGDSVTPQSLNELVNAVRTIMDVHFIISDPEAYTITVRADEETLNAVSRLLQGLKDRQPQVILDVDVVQVSGTVAQSLGVTLPNSITVTPVQTSMVLTALSISTGNYGIAIPSISVGASRNRGDARTLDSLTVRANQGESAVMKIGQRYPVLASQYSSVTGNANFGLPLPAFNYEDIGFDLKATPTIHRNRVVDLKLELQLRSLGEQDINGIPVILNSEYNGFVSARDGESIVVAGDLAETTLRSRAGWPLLSSIPGLASVFSNSTKQVNDDELLVIITPHITIPNGGVSGPLSFVFRPMR